MKVIIFGSKGYLGRHLTAQLESEGLEFDQVSSQDGSGIDPITGLLPQNFEISADAETTVVYLSQSPRFRDVPHEAPHILAVNTHSAICAATAAFKAGVRRFIYISTGTVYAPSFSPLDETAPVRRDTWYTLSKLHAEETLQLFRESMEIIVVRPFTLYGPTQTGRLIPNLIDSVRSHRPISINPRKQPSHPDNQSDGGLRISLCHISDAVRVILHLIHFGGPGLLNLASPEAPSIRELAEMIGTYLGITPQFEIINRRREYDLVADITLLRQTIPHSFIPLESGLKEIVDSL
jgi:UDP-glucose 4-epimerase